MGGGHENFFELEDAGQVLIAPKEVFLRWAGRFRFHSTQRNQASSRRLEVPPKAG